MTKVENEMGVCPDFVGHFYLIIINNFEPDHPSSGCFAHKRLREVYFVFLCLTPGPSPSKMERGA
jgi:hypothetical protein